MDLVDRLISIIEPTIDAMGYELVRVQIQGNRRQTVQVMADRKDGASMTVDDCSDISHAVSAVLDVEDPIAGAYNLEISSPGIDRPLTRLKDFEAWAGFECKLEAKGLQDGRKRYAGKLLGLEGSDVLLLVDGETFRVPFDAVSKAKLVLTDELIAAVTQGADLTDPDGDDGDLGELPDGDIEPDNDNIIQD
ncbi:ribosome maturation factor RimP [Insolitispirillum peregrinum]|uniref:ribosome maturation factor RimP n=1 Tax=Insolitispirillum peregrinum TaxID=80876 RepID=UPI00361787CA